ncbi:MAG: pyruvate kinase, partial [Anaerolineaceae bacterium]|nr:pyruvate kinase [Anaerolineaceae bacterium]
MSGSRLDQKRTKIVATIGPASSDEQTLRAIVRGGMNVARINFSHGEHDIHGETIDRIRRIAREENEVVAIMCDLQGPKIRIGLIPQEPLNLDQGDNVRLTLNESLANSDRHTLLLPHPEFMRDVHQGMP